MEDAAHAAGDGYTILFASSSIVVNPSLYKKIPFDVKKNLIPVTRAGASPNSWLVNRDFPAKTMKELIDLMKASPGQLTVASPGTGTTPSLSIELLKQELGVSFVTVPFAGGADDSIAARRLYPHCVPGLSHVTEEIEEESIVPSCAL